MIDIHAHALHSDVLTALEGVGLPGFDVVRLENCSYATRSYGPLDQWLYDIEARCVHLRKRGVQRQYFAPPPPLIASPQHACDADLARKINDGAARLQLASGGILRGLICPPLGQPAHIAQEIYRAFDAHGFPGIAVTSHGGAVPLDDARFAPLFETAEALGLFIFVHPSTWMRREDLGTFTLQTLVGYPFENTVAAARLIFSGLFERLPNLKIVLSHGGGALVLLKGRIDRGYFGSGHEANPACRANITKAPSEYFRHFHYDTCTLDENHLRLLAREIGSDRILFGTDCPYEIGDPDGDVALPFIAMLAENEQKQILSGNAASLGA